MPVLVLQATNQLQKLGLAIQGHTHITGWDMETQMRLVFADLRCLCFVACGMGATRLTTRSLSTRPLATLTKSACLTTLSCMHVCVEITASPPIQNANLTLTLALTLTPTRTLTLPQVGSRRDITAQGGLRGGHDLD